MINKVWHFACMYSILHTCTVILHACTVRADIGLRKITCCCVITYRMNEVRADFWLGYFQPSTQNISAVFVYNYTGVVIHIWNHEFCTRQMGPVHQFQFDRIILCGDVHPQTGPALKVKHPCKECRRNVLSNQNAILCANCEAWTHTNCLGFSNTLFKHYLKNPHIDWICNWWRLPFYNHSDLGFNFESNISNNF